ncbi:MAG: GntR family transcriptional regulator [Clostridia bacterium]|nr:GntR family transcriptional regulator [Clostridia bacterium]
MKTGNNKLPLHSQLMNELEKAIISGKYKPGEMIPSENELAASHKISRPTVRQAFSELVAKGLLKKVKGKGTFVSEFDKKTALDHTKGFLHTLLDCNDNNGRAMISVYLVDGNTNYQMEKLIDKFGVEFSKGFSAKFVKAEYFFKKEGVYCESFLPLTYFPEAPGLLEKNALSYDLLTGKLPLDPRNAKCKINIVAADRKQADALGLSIGAPVIRLESFLLSGRQLTVEYCASYYKLQNTEIIFNKNRKI